MDKQERTQHWLNNQGEGFHVRLLHYLKLSLTQEEKNDIIENNKIVFFNFEDGKYSIKWQDLVDKATEEGDDILKNNEFNW